MPVNLRGHATIHIRMDGHLYHYGQCPAITGEPYSCYNYRSILFHQLDEFPQANGEPRVAHSCVPLIYGALPFPDHRYNLIQTKDRGRKK